MSRYKFSCGKFDAVVRAGFHDKSPYSYEEAEGVFGRYGDGVDALVLEIRGSEVLKAGGCLEDALQGVVDGELCCENSKLVDYAFDRGVPIYAVEPQISDPDRYNRLLRGVFFDIAKMFVSNIRHSLKLKKYSVKDIEVDEGFVRDMYGFMSDDNRSLGVGRNSVWVEKVLGYVAPKIAEGVERVPKIGFDIGAAHLGLKYDFLNERNRKMVLDSMKTGEIDGAGDLGDKFSYTDYDVGKVGGVYVAERKDGNWKVSSENSGLF